MIIGDTHDQSAPAFHQILHIDDAFCCVMPGLAPGIRVLMTPHGSKTWMAGTRPGHEG
jgi:hypothetical protein